MDHYFYTYQNMNKYLNTDIVKSVYVKISPSIDVFDKSQNDEKIEFEGFELMIYLKM